MERLPLVLEVIREVDLSKLPALTDWRTWLHLASRRTIVGLADGREVTLVAWPVPRDNRREMRSELRWSSAKAKVEVRPGVFVSVDTRSIIALVSLPPETRRPS